MLGVMQMRLNPVLTPSLSAPRPFTGLFLFCKIMKLSAINIQIIETLFEGVRLDYDSGDKPSKYAYGFYVKDVYFEIGTVELSTGEYVWLQAEQKDKFASFPLRDETTVQDFENACKFLGVELKRKAPLQESVKPQEPFKYAAMSDFFGGFRICINCGKAKIDHPLPGLYCPDTFISLLQKR